MSDEYADDLAALYDPETPAPRQHGRSVLVPVELPDSAAALCGLLVSALENADGPPPEPGEVHPLDAAALDRVVAEFRAAPQLPQTGTHLVRVGGPGRPRRLILGISLHRSAQGVAARAFDATEVYETQFRYAAGTARLTQLIEALDDGVIFTDGGFRLHLINRTMLELGDLHALGPLSPGADAHGILRALEAQVDRDGAHAPATAETLMERGLRTTDMLQLTDGRSVLRHFAPLYAGPAFLGNLWLFRDITEERDALLALQRRNRDLADLSEDRLRFTAAATHELRNPLTTITSFCALLTGPGAEPLTGEQRSHIAVVERCAERMARIVDDLLVISRLENQALPLNRSEVDLPALCVTAVTELGPRAEAADLALSCETGPGPALWADRTRLRQVLDNLLGNAVKFTPHGGTVRLSATYDATRARWTVRVTDTGIGVPEAFLTSLFTPFRRAGNTRGSRGSGLGLHITRGLVERHGGTLALTSAEGSGTTVTVTLPLAPVDLRKAGAS